jgi:hypothetical protein
MKGILLRLYPRRWRRRYGPEVARLLDDLGPLTVRRGLDLILGALDAHLTLEVTVPAPVRAAIRRALIVAAILWLVFSVGIVLSNVVFPRPQSNDDGPWPAIAYLVGFAAFWLVGRLAAKVAAGWRIHALAGAIAGAFLGIFSAGTFFAIDNIFLSIVSQQQTKIDGLAQSGMGSMRAYLNHDLIGPLVFWTVGFAVLGAVLAVAGGATVHPTRATQESAPQSG